MNFSKDKLFAEYVLRLGAVIALAWLYIASFIFAKEYYFEAPYAIVNTPDHLVYHGIIQGLDVGSVMLSGVNNYAVSIFYFLVSIGGTIDVVILSAVINYVILVFLYVRLEGAVLAVSGSLMSPLSYLAFMSVFYFLPLINKDVFSLLFFLSFARYMIFRHWTDLVIILFCFLFRVQSLLFIAVYLAVFGVFQDSVGRVRLLVKLLVAYFALSMVSAYVSLNDVVASSSGTVGGGGVSAMAHKLNESHYVGSLIFNILRPVQYAYDLFRSVVLDESVLGAFHIVARAFLLIFFLRNFVFFLSSIYFPFMSSDRIRRAVCGVLVTFFLVWSISPIIHYRYILCLVPIFILLASLRSAPQMSIGGRGLDE